MRKRSGKRISWRTGGRAGGRGQEKATQTKRGVNAGSSSPKKVFVNTVGPMKKLAATTAVIAEIYSVRMGVLEKRDSSNQGPWRFLKGKGTLVTEWPVKARSRSAPRSWITQPDMGSKISNSDVEPGNSL